MLAQDEEGELPYRIVHGKKFYLDELDIAGLLDGQAYLRPFDRESYDPFAYLWKKIEDIDPERRVRLIEILRARHLRALWKVAQQKLDTFGWH